MPQLPPSRSLLWIAPELFPEPGGIGNQAAYMAGHLSLLGWKVTVLADTCLISAQEAKAFDKKQPYTIRRIFRSRAVWATYWKRIQNFYAQAKRNEVVVCSGKWPIWVAGLVSPFLSRKWVAVVHGSELDLSRLVGRWWLRRSLRRFDKVIAVSSYTAQHLPSFGPKGPQVQVIGNGIEPTEFERVGMNGYSRSTHGYPALITVGSVKERKGQRKVIEAMPHILKQFPNAKYHVVGLPNETDALRNLADSLGLNGTVKFYGVQSREATQHLLKASDVFLLPSQHTEKGDFEGYGIAILEANALGVPAVASLHSGSRDAMNDESGVLVEDASPKDLTEAIATIVKKPESYSKAAIQFSKSRSWERVAQEYHKLLLS
ncbi:MAG TPA: glycosyltransferase [Cytophagales bacterium]|nr:glycosyltransferase [Cytophagales bacterium]HAA19943.1 glycosyltransferase [Cytophagales bacterium]HAP62630.1 glycosyltransferase [Cytophagales bacterium]